MSRNNSNDSTNATCEICKDQELDGIASPRWIYCDEDNLWYHIICLGLTSQEAATHEAAGPQSKFKCRFCSGAARTYKDVSLEGDNSSPQVNPYVSQARQPILIQSGETNSDAQSGSTQKSNPATESTSSSSSPTDKENDSSSQSQNQGPQANMDQTVGDRERLEIAQADINSQRLQMTIRKAKTKPSTCRKSTATPVRVIASTSRQQVDPAPLEEVDEDIDEEEIEEIVNHDGRPPNRLFEVRYRIDKSTLWFDEKDLGDCKYLVVRYIKAHNLAKTILKGKLGHTGQQPDVEENWAFIEEVVDKAKKYGKRDGIQPEVYSKRPNKDALLAIEIGVHCYGALYLHRDRMILVADGLNYYNNDSLAKQFFKEDFPGVQLKLIRFVGQTQDNRCAGSAAAILIEFQKIYRSKAIPDVIKSPPVTFSRISRVLHKVETPKLSTFVPIHERLKDPSTGVTCPKCKRHWPKVKSAAILNLHKCP